MDLPARIEIYIEENKEEYDSDKYELRDKGLGVYVGKWTFQSPKPSMEQLAAIDVSAIEDKKKVKKNRSKLFSVAVMEQKEIDGLDVEDGTIIYNSNQSSLQIFYDKIWVNI